MSDQHEPNNIYQKAADRSEKRWEKAITRLQAFVERGIVVAVSIWVLALIVIHAAALVVTLYHQLTNAARGILS